MTLHGSHILGGERSGRGARSLHAVDPAAGRQLAPAFHEATAAEVDRALQLAHEAFGDYRARPPEEIAGFLEAITDAIVGLGDALIDRATAETGLPRERLTGERGRTVNQLRMFAALVREGSWVDARIDLPEPERKPLPKPDLRRMLIPIGPVVVFGASNFPLAFSVAGGDTASALAAGCPVVLKAHPAHPGTSELVGEAIAGAARAAGMPPGVFSLLHGASHELGLALVRHPLTKAVGFTGSLRAGRALYDAAAARPEPIPVFAEMGSINPLFVLPGALRERGPQIAQGLVQSATLGVGQFCTKPGIVVGVGGDEFDDFVDRTGELIGAAPAGTMLHRSIRDAFARGVAAAAGVAGVTTAGRATATVDEDRTQAAAQLLRTDARTFLKEHKLHEEMFGPAALAVACGSREELEAVARSLEGQLTTTLHGTADDLREHAELVRILETRAGRLIFNGFPTGVEVCAAMHHGGPYPATTDVRTTSVGTAAIHRFARPVCYQNFPQDALPEPLRDANPRGIWRQVNGQITCEAAVSRTAG